MRVRPVVFFTLLATSMIAWLLVRMYDAQSMTVWTLSCILGAWAPIASAAIFQYVRAVADREDSVGVAWLVRACGMHLVLVWMLGASDWLRGPPGHAAHWNADAGAPVVLVLFAPAFAAGYFASNWVLSVVRRLAGAIERPAMPTGSSRVAAAFRGARFVSAGVPIARWPLEALIVGGVACGLALSGHGSPWLTVGAALTLALCSARNHRAVGPSVGVLVALLAIPFARMGHAVDVSRFVAVGVAWPWLALATVVGYLAALEGLLRGRRYVSVLR